MEEYINDWESCEYCEEIYYEYDTGYREYGCSFITGDEHDYPCCDDAEDCPLSFKYKVTD